VSSCKLALVQPPADVRCPEADSRHECPVEHPCRNNCGTPDQAHGYCSKCNPRRPCTCELKRNSFYDCPRCNPCLKCGVEGMNAYQCNSPICRPRCVHGNGRGCRKCKKEKKEKAAMQ
jgi:hypothetical protein